MLAGAGTKRWVLTDVIGAEDGLGVECLSGSGAIASVFSRAWTEGFSITLVSARTVGIGAYLARLGRYAGYTSATHLQRCAGYVQGSDMPRG